MYIRGTKAQNDIALAMVKQIAGGHPLEPTTDLPKTVMEAVATSNAMEFTLPGFLIREVLTGIDGKVSCTLCILQPHRIFN